MARVTNTEVSDIFDTDLSGSQLDIWIGIANQIVDDVASADSSVSSSRLKELERLLSAHLAATQDPRLSSASRETASADYRRSDDYATDYLASAVSLDPTGVIAGMNKPNAGVSSLDVKGLESDSY